ncbi:hypothetical protein ABPG72_017097 [Tetrahymena utriculariae]
MKSILKKPKCQETEIKQNKIIKKVQIKDGKLNQESELINIVMAFWNIQGAPKQKIKKMEDQKTINKKAQIEIIENQIGQQAGQQGVALMTICESNLSEDEKRRHSTLAKQINNYKEQQTASGMSTSSNYQKMNKILEKMNDDKMQIIRIQVGNKNITTIACHLSQVENVRKKQIDKINIVTDTIEQMQDNLGTIILGDFNINLKQEDQWKKLNNKLNNKYIKNINQNTRENRQIDDILISQKLKQIIIKQQFYTGKKNDCSDHQPILMNITITVEKNEIYNGEGILYQKEMQQSEQEINTYLGEISCIQQKNYQIMKDHLRQKLGMEQEDIAQKNQYDRQINDWNMNQEIKKILKNRNIREIIAKKKRRENPTIEEGFAHTLHIPNNIIKELYQNYQKYQIQTLYITNMNLSSLESQ